MQNKRVFVTGLGLISALGMKLKDNEEALLNSSSGLSKLELLDTIHRGQYTVGEIKKTNEELASLINLPDIEKYPRTTLLAMIAAREAFDHAGASAEDGTRTGLIAGTTVGGMDRTERYYDKVEEDSSFILAHHCGYTTEKIGDYLGVHDYITTLSTACSSAANAMMLGARMIKAGMLDRVVTGGTDALSRFTLNGFKTLLILDPEHCKPFDKNRKGLNLGEGAGFIVLESEESAQKNNSPILCELSGYANANDAFHQTASSPDGTGPFLSMKNALEEAGLAPSDIDYINVHGTGTENNDLTEGLAIKRLFENAPPFSSTKAFTGHLLGGAGGVEAVFSILAIKNQCLFPNLNFKEAIEETGLIPQTEFRDQIKVKHVMTNSFGFGGNDTTLIFSGI